MTMHHFNNDPPVTLVDRMPMTLALAYSVASREMLHIRADSKAPRGTGRDVLFRELLACALRGASSRGPYVELVYPDHGDPDLGGDAALIVKGRVSLVDDERIQLVDGFVVPLEGLVGVTL